MLQFDEVSSPSSIQYSPQLIILVQMSNPVKNLKYKKLQLLSELRSLFADIPKLPSPGPCCFSGGIKIFQVFSVIIVCECN